jgi:hypothetical protein
MERTESSRNGDSRKIPCDLDVFAAFDDRRTHELEHCLLDGDVFVSEYQRYREHLGMCLHCQWVSNCASKEAKDVPELDDDGNIVD